jgi:hypothetical protein
MNPPLPSEQERTDRRLRLVTFRAGGYRFGLEARRVRNAQASCEHPATALETLLGFSPDRNAHRRDLVLRGQNSDFRLSISEPLELVHLPHHAIHPLPPLLAARNLLPALYALALIDGTPPNLVALLDPSLLESAGDR